MLETIKAVVVWLAVLALSLAAACPIYRTLYKTAKGFPAIDATRATILAEGSLIANAGLCAVLVCLVLRLRNYRNDLVTPPSLVGPILIVVIGAALALGGAIGAPR